MNGYIVTPLLNYATPEYHLYVLMLGVVVSALNMTIIGYANREKRSATVATMSIVYVFAAFFPMYFAATQNMLAAAYLITETLLLATMLATNVAGLVILYRSAKGMRHTRTVTSITFAAVNVALVGWNIAASGKYLEKIGDFFSAFGNVSIGFFPIAAKMCVVPTIASIVFLTLFWLIGKVIRKVTG